MSQTQTPPVRRLLACLVVLACSTAGLTAAQAAPECPCTLHAASDAPPQDRQSIDEGQPLEVGVKVRSDVDGTISAIRFHKGAGDDGAHTGHLWTAEGEQLAEVAFTGETDSGWQQADLATPVAVTAGTTYVASYSSPSGFFGGTPTGLAGGLDAGPLHAPAGSADAPNGLFTYGEGFPTRGSTWDYYVDVVLEVPVDTGAPALSGLSASSSADGTALVVRWTTDEPSDSRVVLDGGAAAGSPDLTTAHEVTVPGLSPHTTHAFTASSTDGAGNTGSATGTGSTTTSVSDTLVPDLAAGTGTGTDVTNAFGGEVTLAAARGEEFGGSVVPDGFTTSPWMASGGASTEAGALVVDGAQVVAGPGSAAGASLELRATFAQRPFQHAGFGVDLNDGPWAIFSTKGGAGLFARVSPAPGVFLDDVPLGADLLGSPHRYRIDWRDGEVAFWVDGQQVALVPVTYDRALSLVVSDYSADGVGVALDWLHLTPYVSSGERTSRVLDAGAAAVWGRADVDAVVPDDTALAVSYRAGATEEPDGTWSTWQPATDGTVGLRGRYLQYRAELSTADSRRTPVLYAVRVLHAPPPPNTAPTAIARAVSTRAGVPVKVRLTGSDAEGDRLSYTITRRPSHGAVTGGPSPDVRTYAPAAGFTGTDRFTFSVGDGQLRSTGVVTVEVLAQQPPTVTGLSVAKGPVGTVVVVRGTGLTGAGAVTVGAVEAPFAVLDDQRVRFTVPSAAVTGPVVVTTQVGSAASPKRFVVTPTMTSHTPDGGPMDTSVTVTGTGLTGVTSFRFNGSEAPFDVVSDTEIRTTVPYRATTGPITLGGPGYVIASGTPFTVVR